MLESAAIASTIAFGGRVGGCVGGWVGSALLGLGHVAACRRRLHHRHRWAGGWAHVAACGGKLPPARWYCAVCVASPHPAAGGWVPVAEGCCSMRVAPPSLTVAAQCTLEALKMVTMCSTGLNNYMM